MSCHCVEKVSLLIDGELPASEVREVERHLLECAECQEVRDDFLGLRQQLSSYPAAVDFATQQKALHTILGDPNTEALRPQRRFGFEWSFGKTAVAFASLLLLGLLLGLVTYRSVLLKKSPELTADNQDNSRKPTPSPVNDPVKETPKPIEEITGPPKEEKKKENKPAQKRLFPALDSKDIFATNRTEPVETPAAVNDEAPVRAADAVTMTAMHFEKSELLLRSFRNVRLDEPGKAEVDYEKKKAQQLVYQNMMLRREADSAGDVQTATLLEDLEPILIDIANLPKEPANDDIRVIKERVERKNIVALLQVNSAALARGLD
jgi:hypothetical protein